MKKKYLVLNASLFVLIITVGIIFSIDRNLLTKSIASILFVILGITNLILISKEKSSNKFALFMIVGLFFAMLGDIVLELNFIIGAILFALGHIWYIIAYSCLLKFKPTDLIAGFSIFIPSILLITLAPIFNFDGILMKIVCIIYALIISLMVGKSIHNLINQKNVLNVILVIGSILFFISDFMLLLSRFAGLHVLSYVCINTYYPAQALLSSSIKYSKINK